MANIALFGVEDRIIDFSQFKPRGHYTDDPRLESYFRAMIWLGRIDFPFLHTDSDTGKQVLVRRSVAAAFALRALLDDPAMARWQRLDRTIRAFVGEPDSMAPPEVDRLKADLGLPAYDVTGVSDAALAQAIVAGAYGKQKILSQIVIQAPHDGPWPLDAVFLFFGQRYTFDSHVFSNVVYDRVAEAHDAQPAGRGLRGPGQRPGGQAAGARAAQVPVRAGAGIDAPAGRRARRRVLGGEPVQPVAGGAAGAVPRRRTSPRAAACRRWPARRPWGRRMLNTQLASWAQLRHDTILYVKQSYTSGVACEFPDAYVDPYPAFYARLQAFAQAGQAVTGAAAAVVQFVPGRAASASTSATC